ncbi:hypothetical protein Clacol_005311 [Clathrus columnatus]|uniref:Nephrocystin 3-like N-terminal domain-containing protein n=1 Tax=Clathrus columnatus TaxID=1419009 RepID=A0AAV5AGL2_9AGAM|nr:hypothetical protein Clacol_005311 [Clathrus columnatus]
MHAQPKGILALDNELDGGKLNDSMREVSQVLDGTRDITGNHLESDNKAYRYKEVASNVVQRLSVFTNLVQSIADIITNTQDVDQNILDLFETLDATYKFIADTKGIENHPSYKRILSTLAKQTVDCAYFVRDYAKNANFWIRVGKNVIGGPIKTRVQTYQMAFSRLLAEFRTHSSLHTELAVGRVLELNREICEVLYLDSLPYAVGAGLNTRKQCLLGTRREVLDEIVNWINDGDENCPKLFWLAGAAGVGKSAIAHSIAVRFESIGRLGSFFCFDRNYSLERRRGKVFSTIARDLADLDLQIKHKLANVIRNKTSLRTTTDLHLQWKNFIFEPLNAIFNVSTGPILIIVDALDECDNPSSRQDLLKVLEMEITSLPANVRFLVTSRLENDIILTFNKLQPHIRIKMMDTIPESESKRDILTYLKANLDSFGEAQLMHLVGLSQGLFQWAYLASQFLNGLGNSAGLTVAERYENLIRTQRIRSINDPLDTMYTQILSSLFDTGDSLVMTRFRSIIGSIIASSEPLSLQTLLVLRGDKLPSSKRESDIKVVIRYMGSLLSGIDDPSSTIRPLHLSFREYLLDANRSHKFSIDPSPCHHDFAVGCIRTMMEGLRFNICDIPDSHKRNSDYEDLPERVLSSISIPLSIRFLIGKEGGGIPLSQISFMVGSSELDKSSQYVCEVDVQPHFLEFGGKSHKGLYDFVVDGKRFVRLFGDAIAVSAPHIYLSALPFCPQDSVIYKTYIKQYPNTLRIASGPIYDWSLASTGSDVGHADCISFSHGGEYLAICSFLDWDVFKLLDSETFDVLWTGKVPDNEIIYAIQFSSGDRTLVLATQIKVYLFDILMGGLTLHWEFQLTYGEMRLSQRTTFSLDARYIAFLVESSLIVWNLETEEETINIPFDNRYRDRADFAFLNNNSGRFVTYFVDIGAQVWDLETGAILHGPLRPPWNLIIYQTIVSPNGKDIFFLNNFRHLHKWSFQDKSLMAFAVGRQHIIHRVSISPDGDCVITESFGRLTLHDMNRNELHCEIDIDTFRSAFSKDGKYLASCDRGRLNIWELDGWQTTPNIQQSTLPPARPEFQTVSSDGKYFLAENTSTEEKDYFEMWDVELERPIWKLNHFESIMLIMLPIFSPLNRYLAYISGRQIATIYDIHSGITKELEFLPNGKKAHMQYLVFAQDETRIATLDVSQLHIWDIASCKIVDTLTIPGAKATMAAPKVFWGIYRVTEFPIFCLRLFQRT